MAETGLLARFVAAAEQVGAGVVLTDRSSLRDRLVSLADATPESSVRLSLEVREHFPELADISRGNALEPDIVIACGRLAVASTGTVAVAEAGREDRVASLLCTHHVLLVPGSAVVECLQDTVQLMRTWMREHRRPYITFVSGPSRTSDIERVLTIGVHGPRSLTAVMVDGWDPHEA